MNPLMLYPGVTWLCHWENLFLAFWRTSAVIYLEAAEFYIPTNNKGFSVSISLPSFVTSFLDESHPHRCGIESRCSFSFISLTANDVEHIKKCL